MSQREIIIQTLLAAHGYWIHGYNLRSKMTLFGWLGHQGDRLARKLAEEGSVESGTFHCEPRLCGKDEFEKPPYAHYRIPRNAIAKI